MCQISWASQRYKWPSWVVFDQNFRQLVADQGLTSLAHLDTTLYTQCFSGQGKECQSWCQYCHSLDHASVLCPLKPRPIRSPSKSTHPQLSHPQKYATTSTSKRVANSGNAALGFTNAAVVGVLTLKQPVLLLNPSSNGILANQPTHVNRVATCMQYPDYCSHVRACLPRQWL